VVSGIPPGAGRDVISSHANSDIGFEFFNRIFQGWEGTSWGMSKEMANFLAGGMASNLYWGMALRMSTARSCLTSTDLSAMDNVKNRIMSESDSVSGERRARLTPTADSVTKPRYHGVFDAYRQTWTETFDPTKTFGWNSAARIKNFYRVCRPCVIARPALT
jgi:solute carrier family 25 carnitine/acylcarnitine transporter 20/29